MKTLLTCLIVLLITTSAMAAPCIRNAAQPGVTTYLVTNVIPSSFILPASVPAQSDGSVCIDVATAPTGFVSMKLSACSVDPIWGTQCNAAVPFSFTRPASPGPSSYSLTAN